MSFILKSPYKPAGGQPEAIKQIVEGFKKKKNKQTLLGITGSGKTFVMANVIQELQKPALIVAHNKTLAAQLYAELKDLFPDNAVEYFISYYDYYQPESYLPTTDTYIEKEATINEQIEKMRLRTTASLLARDDVIVVASISCIYGLSNPDDFRELSIQAQVSQTKSRQELIKELVQMQYERATASIEEGQFRVTGDVIDIWAPYQEYLTRIELFGDTIDRISYIHPVTADVIQQAPSIVLFAAKQFVVPEEKQQRALLAIEKEAEKWIPNLSPLEAERCSKRVKYDLEMIEEVGYCSGIENYSRHFDGRKPGEPPYTLLDYFPKDFLLIIDESHQTLPQSRGMYKGDFSRKENLVNHGFRLPCAFDNRPFKFHEFEKYHKNALYVSATPGPYEHEHSDQVVELIIRPTGLLDPTVEIRPEKDQIPNLIKEINKTVAQGDRVLVTTLTKRMAEDLTNYLAGHDIRVRYMHSEIETLDRIELVRQLRAKEYDVLIGINLLREGLDIPEVSLVAILDADKQGYLRNETSLLQTFGRAARNEKGHVIMYARTTTDAMERAKKITEHRRRLQKRYNKKHSITPQTIIKRVAQKTREIKSIKHLPTEDLKKKIAEYESDMYKAAEQLDFEKAIELRDLVNRMKEELG